MEAVVSRGALALIGMLLVESGLHKAEHRQQFLEALRTWWFLPAEAVPTLIRIVPRLEVLVGAFIVSASVSDSIRWASISAIALFAVFALIQVLLVASRKPAKCGCFGGDEPLSAYSIIRPAAVLVVSAACLYSTS